MARCNCDSTCSCVITGADTDTTSTNVSGTGSAANPYVVTVDTVGAAPNVPACKVFNSTNQLISDNTPTVVAFNSERFDTDTMHDTVTLNSRITFNTAGVYVVEFHGFFAAGADYNYTQVEIRLNGVTVIGIGPGAGPTGGASFEHYLNATTIFKFAVADYVETVVYHDNTANTARNLVASGGKSPEFAASRLGAG
jgi:hypothetical protein